MRYLLVILIVFFSLQCDSLTESKDNNDQFIAECENITELQKECGTLLESLLKTIDTVKAYDSIVRVFENDSLVDEVTHDTNNIMVLYKNGVLGGVVLSNRIDTTRKVSEFQETKQKSQNDISSDLMGCFISSGNPMNSTPFYLLNQNLGIKLTELDATVDNFTKLSDYSVICLHGHGNIVKFIRYLSGTIQYDNYLETSEKVNTKGTTFSKYGNIIKSGGLPLIYVIDMKNSYYYISASFVNQHNNFNNHETLFYGYFCNSSHKVSEWPTTLGTGNNTFVGFDTLIESKINSEFMTELLVPLTDVSVENPVTIESWYNNSNTQKTKIGEAYLGSVKIKCETTILYKGNGDLTLWKKPLKEVWTVEGAGFLEDGDGTLTLEQKPGEDITIPYLEIVNDPYSFIYDSKSITINGENIEFKLNGTISVGQKTSLFDLEMTGVLTDGIGAGTFILNFNEPSWNDDTGNWTATLQSGSGITMTSSNQHK